MTGSWKRSATRCAGRRLRRKNAFTSANCSGKIYYFDSEECARQFDAHPARYYDVASGMYPVYDY
jgi:YHS domain-containing protein